MFDIADAFRNMLQVQMDDHQSQSRYSIETCYIYVFEFIPYAIEYISPEHFQF